MLLGVVVNVAHTFDYMSVIMLGTGVVAYRLARNGVPQQSALGNGGSWAVNAKKRGFRVDTTPKTIATMCRILTPT